MARRWEQKRHRSLGFYLPLIVGLVALVTALYLSFSMATRRSELMRFHRFGIREPRKHAIVHQSVVSRNKKTRDVTRADIEIAVQAQNEHLRRLQGLARHNLTYVDQLVLRDWGPDAKLVQSTSSSTGQTCLRLQPPEYEPLYGTLGPEDLARFRERAETGRSMASFLRIGPFALDYSMLTEEDPDEADEQHRPGSSRSAGHGAKLGTVGSGLRAAGSAESSGTELSGKLKAGPMQPTKVPGPAGAVARQGGVVLGRATSGPKTPPKATATANGIFITLTTNKRVAQLLRMLETMDRHVPSSRGYPHAFFSETRFRADVQRAVRRVLCNKTAAVSFELIPPEHWRLPDGLDEALYSSRLAAFANDSHLHSVPHITSRSYRLMCRWYSGFFFKHPALQAYDYYFRVDDDLRFLCDVHLDPLMMMQDNRYVYGFTMALYEFMGTVPTLMATVESHFAEGAATKDMSTVGWLEPCFYNAGEKPGDDDGSDADAGPGQFTGCHFWNNLSLGSLAFFRSAAYGKLFDRLDKAGGIFLERWGDAPIQTLAVAALSEANETFYFNEISYGHDQQYHKPASARQCSEPVATHGTRSDQDGTASSSCARKILMAQAARAPLQFPWDFVGI
ncbi:O-glycoside alpha-1 [Diplonema papillatum]|nr:O-glycoside alpha-1 [Diplonema papillatum]|eukprot:gene18513-28573_t